MFYYAQVWPIKKSYKQDFAYSGKEIIQNRTLFGCVLM